MGDNDLIVIREYVPEDKEAVMRLLRLNTPEYFAPEEEADFSEYLDRHREEYYVLLLEGKVVGCGGINIAGGGRIGRISWDMVSPDCQGRGMGRRLLQHRLERLREMGGVEHVTVRTSQLAYRFYEKEGFVLRDMRKDYWAEGLDMYGMEYGGWKEGEYRNDVLDFDYGR